MTDEPIVVHPESIGHVDGSVEIRGMEGDPPIFLPRYDPKSFPEGDRVRIPDSSGYKDAGHLIYEVAADFDRGRVPMLWGPSGVGKTYLARHMAYLMRLPFDRIPLGETSEREDVTGHYELRQTRRGTETFWVQSRLARAFTRPGVVCIDEWNAAPAAVLHVARPILDDSHQLPIDAWDGRVLIKHDNCFLIATGNPDWMPQYAGLMPLSEADSDRLSHIDVTWSPDEVEATILMEHATRKNLDRVTAWEATLAIRTWVDLRAAIKDRGLPITAGTRSLLNFVECLQYHSPRGAIAKVYQRMDPRDFSEVQGFVDHHDWSLHCTPLLLDCKAAAWFSSAPAEPQDDPGDPDRECGCPPHLECGCDDA